MIEQHDSRQHEAKHVVKWDIDLESWCGRNTYEEREISHTI